LVGNTLSLTNDATPVSLIPYLDNTDNQDLELTGNSLSLTNDGTPVSLLPYLDNTDNQDLSLAGSILSLTNDGTPVSLIPFMDNTDSQTLSTVVSPGSIALSISGGNSVTLGIDDADANPTNEHNIAFWVNGANLDLTDGGGTFSVPLTSLAPAGKWTENAGNLYPTTLTNNVGIGTTTPTYPLDIYYNGIASNAINVDYTSTATGGANNAIYTRAENTGGGNIFAAYFQTVNSSSSTSSAAVKAFNTATSILNTGVEATASGVGASTNYGIFASASGATTNWAGYFDQGNVYIQNNVGISTTAPQFPLHVNTSTQDRAGYFINSTISNSAGGKFGIYAIASGSGSGDNIGGWFDASGTGTGINYGVVGQSLNSVGENRGVYGSAGGGIINWAGYFDVGNVNIINSTYIGGNLLVGAVPSVQAKAQINGTGYSWAFKILGSGSNTQVLGVQTSTGNTIIGLTTGTPANTLDVEGSMAIGATYSGTNTANANSLIVEGDLSIGSPTINSLYKAQITSSADQYSLYAINNRAAGSNYALRGSASSTSGSFNIGVYGQASGAATVNYGLYGLAQTAATTWSLYCNGAAYSSSGTWTGSDEKLKTNVEDFTGAINKLTQINIKTYNFKTDEYKTMGFPKQKQYGLMAQNLEQVFPEMVLESEHFIPDENGNLTDKSVSIKAVNYTQLIPVLIKAVQEQQQMIEELKKEIEELKNK